MKFLILLALITLKILSANLNIIGSPTCKMDTINAKDVKYLFTLKEDTFNTQKIIVLDNADKAVYKKFVNDFLDKSLKKMKVYWVRMIFTGTKQPPRKVSFRNFKDLQNDTNTCHLSYTKHNKKPKSWKVINVIP
jgi:hypothetical protein